MTTTAELNVTPMLLRRKMKWIWRKMASNAGVNPCAATLWKRWSPRVVRAMSFNPKRRSQIVATFAVVVALPSGAETVTTIFASHARGTWHDARLCVSKKEIVCWLKVVVTAGKMVLIGAFASMLALTASFLSLLVLSGSAFSGPGDWGDRNVQKTETQTVTS